MARRWGLGPVFAYEWLTTSRRPQVYAGRALFVGVLLVSLTSVWAAQVAGRPAMPIREMAAVGRAFFGAIVFCQLTLVLLAAPAATAGAVCQDKASGNLAQLFLTDLSSAEIVLGSLAARLVPMLGLVACALPVLALGTLLGGIDPPALAGAFAITLAVAAFACTLALAFSIWGSKPHEVLLATFAVLTVWLLALPIWEFFVWLRALPRPPRWAIASHPYVLALAPYSRPGEVGLIDYAGFLGAISLVSATLVAVMIARLRPVVLAQADRSAVRARGRFAGRGPALDRSPILWYEWHRKRPTPWIRAIIALYAALAVGFGALAIADTVRPGSPMRGWFPAHVNAFASALGLPLLLVSAATALVEERARGSLDILLTTPLSSRSIVLAKWWSAFRHVPVLLALPAVLASLLAWQAGNWPTVARLLLFLLATGAAWTSVGLALSTWVPRVGRAVATAVLLYALAALGWPMLALTLWGTYAHAAGPGLASVSPFHGAFYLTFNIESPRFPEEIHGWGRMWTLGQIGVALALLLATLRTFDRCLGRIAESRSVPGRPLPGPRA